MRVHGTQIAKDIEARVRTAIAVRNQKPRLAILTCAPNLATQKFLALKIACAERVGAVIDLHSCSSERSTEDIIASLGRLVSTCDGIIVQLPFPPHIDVSAVLAAIPASHDVDAIGTEATAHLEDDQAVVLPPVVAAIRAIADVHAVSFEGKRAVVVGSGRLVGKPAAVWLAHRGADVTVVTRETDALAEKTRGADVLVLGAGVPGLITPDMIKEDILIFDAGSSEDAGKLVGDADPRCEEKASLFTPVPGGIGPITVSIIFENLLALGESRGALG